MGSEVHILKPVEQSAINDMGLDNVFYILGAHMDVGRIIGHNPDNGSLGTEAKATSGYNIHSTSQAIIGNHADKGVNDF
jgi:hypothetical protein